MKLFVEGGGDGKALRSECREAFNKFITRAGVKNRPRILACGSRREAYESYMTAVSKGEEAMLLVDSEAPVAQQFQPPPDGNWDPWGHLTMRDGWQKGAMMRDDDCHLMVQCTESWFLADAPALINFFGQGFQAGSLPNQNTPIESVPKATVYQALSTSTRNCKTKAQYGKGAHSFKILGLISPEKVCDASPWAKRFIDTLMERMDS